LLRLSLFDVRDHLFYDGKDVPPSFTGDAMGLFHDFSGLRPKFGIGRNGLLTALILPLKVSQCQTLFLLPDKSHLQFFYLQHLGGSGRPDRIAGRNDDQIPFGNVARCKGRLGRFFNHLVRIPGIRNETGQAAPVKR